MEKYPTRNLCLRCEIACWRADKIVSGVHVLLVPASPTKTVQYVGMGGAHASIIESFCCGLTKKL